MSKFLVVPNLPVIINISSIAYIDCLGDYTLSITFKNGKSLEVGYGIQERDEAMKKIIKELKGTK
jgi:anti-anti-sigma regulatory factor